MFGRKEIAQTWILVSEHCKIGSVMRVRVQVVIGLIQHRQYLAGIPL
jgi:hypothetical protein